MSRNAKDLRNFPDLDVTPRERRVSRNEVDLARMIADIVTPRERRVSRNALQLVPRLGVRGHASREACE